MRFRIIKTGNTVSFKNADTDNKFDYVEFANQLYSGDKLEIMEYGNLSEEEIKIVNKTVCDLNNLSNPRKRKKIIYQLSNK